MNTYPYMPKYHDTRREGRGTHDNPVQQIGGNCTVETCKREGEAERVTESGFHVRYCHVHELQARLLFS